MSGARVMFMDQDDCFSRNVQYALEERGFAAACISAREDEEAGLAFGPDLVVLQPEACLHDGFAVLSKLARSADPVPVYFTRTDNADVRKAMDRASQANVMPVMGSVDRPYDIDGLASILTETPTAIREGSDREHLAKLIASDRLLPNLTVDFQPKVSLRNGRIVGYEALTRLRTRRALDPQLIFSDAISLELESEATRLVVEDCMRLIVALALQGQRKSVSLNCSSTVLVFGGLIEKLTEATGRCGVDPSQVTIEITEEARISNIQLLEARCAELIALGYKLSIDDFGAGLANLDRVSRLPFSELKIDKWLFWECCSGRLPLSLLTSVVELCAMRKARCVVEGIETEEQRQVAKKIGAHLGQGYFWGRAVPPRQFAMHWR